MMQVLEPEWKQEPYSVTTTSTSRETTVYETEPNIPRVGHFEKVSFEQFKHDMKEEFDDTFSEDDIKAIYENIKLPTRATIGSAGYDFKAPFDFEMTSGASIKIPTGIRVIIKDGWFLCCAPRSGMGFKYEVRLFNTIGIIDSSYSQSDNEGHIFVKFRNGERRLKVKQGDGMFQSIFLPHGITDDDEVTAQRNGGLGSTGV